MTFILSPLPYAKNALVPYISEKTLDFHHGKHHQTYVSNLNKLIGGSIFTGLSLEEIVCNAFLKEKYSNVFNNAAQVWNHDFYWHSISSRGGGLPSSYLLDKIKQDFGSFVNFQDLFKKVALSNFGSGWVWLVLDQSNLKIIKTSNAVTPLTDKTVPLLTCDVWEHAYYIDYYNNRLEYIEVFLKNLVNWDFAIQNLSNI